MDVDTVIASEVVGLGHYGDGVGTGIDAGIIETVAILRLLGFRTSASCEGHLDWGLPTPWVDFDVPESSGLDAQFERLDVAREQQNASLWDEASAEIDAQRLQPEAMRAEQLGRLQEMLDDFYRGRSTPSVERLGLVGALGARLCVPDGTSRVVAGRMLSPEECIDDIPTFLAASRTEMLDFTDYLRLRLRQELVQEARAELAPHESALLAVAKAPILSDIHELVNQAPAAALEPDGFALGH